MKIVKLFLTGVLFLVLHGWALHMLWKFGPEPRQFWLVLVYGGTLIGSAFVTKRFQPPFAASLMLFAVVLGWRLIVNPDGPWY